MTVHSSENRDQGQWAPDDEIDLRKYIEVLSNWWREIVLITLLSAIVAGATVAILRQTQQVRYAATATAVIARISSDVNFDERFLTTSEGNVASSAASSRRSALLGLVRSGAIAQAVIDDLGVEWPTGEQAAAALLEGVKAELAPGPDARNPSDLIQITVTADDPDKAALIANTWADYYVDEINAIYGQVPEAVIASVQDEQVQVEQRYLDTQAKLEDFISTSRIESLSRQLEIERALLETLKLGHINTAAAVINRDMTARLDLFNRLIDAEVQPSLALLEQQTSQQVQMVTDLLAIHSQIEQSVGQARALQTQVRLGGDAAAATNVLALQLLKAQVFASTSLASAMTLPNNLQLNVDAVTPTTVAEQQTDIDALIAALEGYLEQIDEQIETLGQEILTNDSLQFVDELTTREFTLSSSLPAKSLPANVTAPADGDSASTPELDAETGETHQADESSLSQAIIASYANLFGLGTLANQAQNAGISLNEGDIVTDDLAHTITELEQNVQTLAAELEGEQALERQLIQQRDLAWTAYETLNSKVVELSLARSAANSEVRLGAPAIPPVRPLPSESLLMATALGGVVGFMFAIFFAFFAAYMGKKPFLRRGAAQG